MTEYDPNLAEQSATKVLKALYSILVPDGSISFVEFMKQLMLQVKTDPAAREDISKAISEEYLAAYAKKSGNPNDVFGEIFAGVIKRDVSKSIPIGSDDILKLPKVGRSQAKAFPW